MQILIVQTSFLGDVVLSTPVLDVLREQYPQAAIDIVTTPAAAALFAHDTRIRKVIPFDKRGKDSGVSGLWRFAKLLQLTGYDLGVALQRAVRSSILLALARIPQRLGFKEARAAFLFHRTGAPRAQYSHEAQRNLAILGAEQAQRPLPLSLYAPPESAVSEAVRKAVENKPRFALLGPGSVWATKRWTVEGFIEVAREFIKQGITPIVVGSKDDSARANVIASATQAVNLVGIASIPDLLWLTQRATAVVAQDSLLLHIASAFQKPTVAVFCSTTESFGFGPWQNSQARVVEELKLPCKPCGRHGHDECPIGTWVCARNVGADRVIEKLTELGIR